MHWLWFAKRRLTGSIPCEGPNLNVPKSCWELISEFGEGTGKPRSPEVAMGENRGSRAFLAASWAPRLGCLSTMLGVGWGGGGGQQEHITYLGIILTDLFSPPPKE